MPSEAEYENKYVHKFYSKKSAVFSASRTKPWPLSISFVEKYTSEHSLVLDSGCGNGRQFLRHNTIGLDYSEELLSDACLKPNIGLVRGNAHSLPFSDSSFDCVMSIAVIHHLSTHERRVEAVREMCRVLKPGGHCLVYVWDESATLKSKFEKIQGQEYFVSWRGENDMMRYYHMSNETELKALCESGGFVVIQSGKEQESVYAILQKPREVK